MPGRPAGPEGSLGQRFCFLNGREKNVRRSHPALQNIQNTFLVKNLGQLDTVGPGCGESTAHSLVIVFPECKAIKPNYVEL